MTKTSETGQFRILKTILHLEILFRIFAAKRRATLFWRRFLKSLPKSETKTEKKRERKVVE